VPLLTGFWEPSSKYEVHLQAAPTRSREHRHVAHVLFPVYFQASLDLAQSPGCPPLG
jgi:hypothetical protein